MTQNDFDTKLSEEQKKTLIELHERSGYSWAEFLDLCLYPVPPLAPYVGIRNFHGMFVGVEVDGHAHT